MSSSLNQDIPNPSLPLPTPQVDDLGDAMDWEPVEPRRSTLRASRLAAVALLAELQNNEGSGEVVEDESSEHVTPSDDEMDVTTSQGLSYSYLRSMGFRPDEIGQVWPLIRLSGCSQSSRRFFFNKVDPSPRLSIDYDDKPHFKRVALIHDEDMLLHTSHVPTHPERPDRISSILQVLDAASLSDCCRHLQAEEALLEDLLRVHSLRMIKELHDTGSALKADEIHYLDEHGDAYANKYSYRAAVLAAGSVIMGARAVLSGKYDSAFALIRPPGHHAESDASMGFCLFNNAAVAARHARYQLGLERVAILDWDVHHGNGTQEIFDNDPSVLYLSVHKGGNFYPYTGLAKDVGHCRGAGFNVNCPFMHDGMGDGDYLSLFRYVFMPIIKEFNPQLFIISAGFDCAAGDTIGTMKVSENGFSHMMKYALMTVPGRVVCALEGGYELRTTAIGVKKCVETMLGDSMVPYDHPDDLLPSAHGFRDILQCIKYQRPYWKCIQALETDEEWLLLKKTLQPALTESRRLGL